MLEKRIVNGGAAIVELPKELQTRILLFVRSVSSYQKTSRGPRGDETLWVSIEADSFVARGDAFETRMARLQSGVARLDVATQAAGDYRKEKLPIHLDLDAVLDSIRLGNGSLFGRLTTEYVAVKVDRDGIVLAFRTAMRPPLTRERPYGIGVPGPPLPSTLGAVQALVTDALSDTPRCSKHVSTRGTDAAYLRTRPHESKLRRWRRSDGWPISTPWPWRKTARWWAPLPLFTKRTWLMASARRVPSSTHSRSERY
jgi:hypothetical protein